MLKDHWKQRALSSLKDAPEKELSKLERDLAIALDHMMGKAYRSGDDHAYVVFCDRTDYAVCSRYLRSASGVANAELPKCAALVVPTDDRLEVPADCRLAEQMCSQCCQILHNAIDEDTNIDGRLLWRDIRTGAIVNADPYGVNLGNLVDMV